MLSPHPFTRYAQDPSQGMAPNIGIAPLASLPPNMGGKLDTYPRLCGAFLKQRLRMPFFSAFDDLNLA